MEKLKLGFIGLGQRGEVLLNNTLNNFPDVEVVAVCDSYADRSEAAAQKVTEKQGVMPAVYTDHSALLADETVKIVIISASWEAHVPLAVEAMRAGKITALEVGGAYSVEDCWQLVRTWEETKVPFMFLENCCYGEKELLATKLTRMGILGEISYCHGAYCHDLRDEICGGVENRHYRLRNYLTRNCDNYPTHNLGPIARLLNINRGNRMMKLVSMGSKSKGLESYVNSREGYDHLKGQSFAQSDIVTTMITCADGTLITLKLDTTLPRAYSRELTVSGTKGIFSERGNAVLVDGGDYDHNDTIELCRDSADKYKDLLPKIWKDITPEQIAAGHGGMDTLMLRAFFDAVHNAAEMPIDVYDAASWMVITCLSEASIAGGSIPVDIPDFTCGGWETRKAEDVVDLA